LGLRVRSQTHVVAFIDAGKGDDYNRRERSADQKDRACHFFPASAILSAILSATRMRRLNWTKFAKMDGRVS
jgi:hypothetical protein